MADIATLGITIDGSSAETSAKRIGVSLDDLGTKGEASARRVQSAGDKITQQLVRQAQQAQQTAAAYDQLRRQQDLVLRTLAERGGAGTTLADNAIRNNGGLERFRQIQQQIQQEMLASDAVAAKQASALANVGDVASNSSIHFGRLRGSVTSMAASMLGAAPGVTQVLSVLGQLAAGSGVTIAILLGISAISAAWKAMSGGISEDTKFATDAIKKLTEEIQKAKNAMGTLTVRAAQSNLQTAKDALGAAQARAASRKPVAGDPTGVFNTALSGADIDAETKAVKNAQTALTFAQQDAAHAQADGLARLVQGNALSHAERVRALALLKQDQAELESLKGKTSDTDISRRIALVGDVDALKSALFPKAATRQQATAEAELTRIADAIKRMHQEADEFGKDQSINTRVQAFVDQLDLLRKNPVFKSKAGEIEALKVAAQDAGGALKQELFDQFGQATDATIRAMQGELVAQQQLTAARLQGQGAVDQLTVKLAGQKAVQEALNRATQANMPIALEQIRVIRETAEAHERAVQADVKVQKDIAAAAEATRKAAEEQQRRWQTMLDEMQRGISGFFQDVFKNGLSSFRSLFDSIKQLFFRLLADLAAAKLAPKLAGVVGGLFGGLAPTAAAAQSPTALPAGVTQVSSVVGMTRQPTSPAATSSALSSTLGFAGAALGGFGAGYGLGTATGSKAIGAVGGAASGAALGFQVAGPWGAAIGGVAGFVGGIIGAGNAAKKAAKQMKEMQDALALNLAAWKASIEGDQLGQALAQAQSGLKDILSQINAAYAGKKWETVRNQMRADATAEEAKQEAKIKAQFADQVKAQQEDYRVRLLRAQGQSEAADDMAFALSQQREYADLVRNNADEATKAALAQAQSAERAAYIANKFKATLDTLAGFANSLKLDSTLSTLGPVDQLTEAKRQYDAIVAQARAGNQTAAGQLPDAARTFLNASRGVNASGSAYSADFQRVLSDTQGVQDSFAAQQLIQQSIADAVKSTGADTVTELKAANTELKALVVTQQASAKELAAKIDTLVAAVSNSSSQTKRALEGLKL